jgi:hypothetical protein
MNVRNPTRSDLLVEGMLLAGVLQRYRVVIDQQNRALAIAQHQVLKRPGVAVPIHINPKTGLIAVDAVIDDKPYSMTVVNGSAYTWVRQSAAKPWLVSHPDWERGIGTVGTSNMMMWGTEPRPRALCCEYLKSPFPPWS